MRISSCSDDVEGEAGPDHPRDGHRARSVDDRVLRRRDRQHEPERGRERRGQRRSQRIHPGCGGERDDDRDDDGRRGCVGGRLRDQDRQQYAEHGDRHRAADAQRSKEPLPIVSASPVIPSSVPKITPVPNSMIVPQSMRAASSQRRVNSRSFQLVGRMNSSDAPSTAATPSSSWLEIVS